MNSYLVLNFDILHAATNIRHAINKDISLVDLGPIALFSNYTLTTFFEKHLEGIGFAHNVCLRYKLITSARGSDGLSTGFDCSGDRGQLELTNFKNTKGKFHNRTYLKNIFSFAEHQCKGTYGVAYRLTITRISDNTVLNKDNATAVGKFEINCIEWYLPHYTASVKEEDKILKQIVDKLPTELRYVERFVFMKEVNIQNLMSFELGIQERKNV